MAFRFFWFTLGALLATRYMHINTWQGYCYVFIVAYVVFFTKW